MTEGSFKVVASHETPGQSQRCPACEASFPRTKFSKTQLRKYKSNARCLICVKAESAGSVTGTRKRNNSLCSALEHIKNMTSKKSDREVIKTTRKVLEKCENESESSFASDSTGNSVLNIMAGQKRPRSALTSPEPPTQPIKRPTPVPTATSISQPNFLPRHKVKVHRQLGDGNCLYRSLSFGLHRLPYSHRLAHRELRRKLADWVSKNARTKINGTEIFKWIKWEKNMSVQEYCRGISGNGGGSNWGGQIELCAFAAVFGIEVNVYESKREGFKKTTAFPGKCAKRGKVDVLYVDNSHYDALVIN